MEWIEATITIVPEAIEIMGALLLENGIIGYQIEDNDDMKNFLSNNPLQWDYIDEELLNKKKEDPRIIFYVSNNAVGNETLLGIKSAIVQLKSLDLGIDLGDPIIKLNNVNDEDWIHNWKKYYKPFEVGKNIVVKPTWEEYENTQNKLIFNINPGHVFGTGLHQTTRLCMVALEKFVNNKTMLLDLGCGSGILSILSVMLGATSAIAVDIDANAVDIAYENADLNHVKKDAYTVLVGNVLSDEALFSELAKKKYSIIVANIVADVIIALTPLVQQLIEQDGIFISSGIIKERLDEVIYTLTANHFVVIDIVAMDEWVLVVSKSKRG